ncbi:hypothetical protein JCM10212_005463 [Sporobolomyces blumeae]
MTRPSLISLCSPPFLIRSVHSSSSKVPHPPRLSALASRSDHDLATTWLSAFSACPPSTWPRDTYSTSFSRSSGPGGQHVNRTESRATVRLFLPCPTLVPPYALPRLEQGPYYSANPASLLVSSSETRSQHSNLEQCFRKLKAIIVDAAERDLVGPTAPEQVDKVKRLIKADKARTEQSKKRRKDVKQGRGKVTRWE